MEHHFYAPPPTQDSGMSDCQVHRCQHLSDASTFFPLIPSRLHLFLHFGKMTMETLAADLKDKTTISVPSEAQDAPVTEANGASASSAAKKKNKKKAASSAGNAWP